jgi:hypothetical protein
MAVTDQPTGVEVERPVSGGEAARDRILDDDGAA